MLKCVHNGSNYYIEKFSSSYLKHLEMLAVEFEAHESVTQNAELLQQLDNDTAKIRTDRRSGPTT